VTFTLYTLFLLSFVTLLHFFLFATRRAAAAGNMCAMRMLQVDFLFSKTIPFQFESVRK
jgi:hypothetical protein